MQVNKQLAQQLREEGCTYKQIAQQLGCSEDWCKRNLKQVVKNNKDEEIYNSAVSLAQTNNGITNIEIRKLIQAAHKHSYSKEDKQQEDKVFNRIKARVRKTEGCIIRPYWLQPQNAQQSFIALMQSTQLISDRIEEEVRSFINSFDLDDSYSNSIRWAIVSLTYAGSKFGSGTDAQSTIDNLERITNDLEERNNSCAPLPHSIIFREKVRTISPICEKSVFVDECAINDGVSEMPESLPIDAYLTE